MVIVYDHRRHRQVAMLSADAPYVPLSTIESNTNTNTSIGITPHFGSSLVNIPAATASVMSLRSLSGGHASSTNLANTKQQTRGTLKTLTCLTISPDGNYVAAGEVSRDVRVYTECYLFLIFYRQDINHGFLFGI
jgi:hypothetical protein